MEKIKEALEIIKTLPNAESFSQKDAEEWKEEDFRAILERRIEHCLSELKSHANEAVVVSSQICCWEGGHFSIPVFDALVEATKQPLKKWDSLIWQQIVRQMAIEKNDNILLYNVATEFLLCSKN